MLKRPNPALPRKQIRCPTRVGPKKVSGSLNSKVRTPFPGRVARWDAGWAPSCWLSPSVSSRRSRPPPRNPFRAGRGLRKLPVRAIAPLPQSSRLRRSPRASVARRSALCSRCWAVAGACCNSVSLACASRCTSSCGEGRGIASMVSVSAVRSTGLEWDGAGMPDAPSAPETIKQAGLSLGFLNDLILKTLYVNGGMLGLDMARKLCLPFKVIEESLRFLKDEKCLEVVGGDLIGRVSYRFNLT